MLAGVFFQDAPPLIQNLIMDDDDHRADHRYLTKKRMTKYSTILVKCVQNYKPFKLIDKLNYKQHKKHSNGVAA